MSPSLPGFGRLINGQMAAPIFEGLQPGAVPYLPVFYHNKQEKPYPPIEGMSQAGGTAPGLRERLALAQIE